MKPDSSLKENIIHGTKERPIHAMHFSADGNLLFVPNHWHHYIEILLIREGSYEFRINLETRILHKGDICILNSGDLHQIKNLHTTACHDALLFEPKILLSAYADEWNCAVLQPFLNQSLLSTNVISSEHASHRVFYPLICELLEISLAKEEHWYEYSKLYLLKLMIELERQHCLVSAESIQSDTEMKKIRRYKQIVSYIELHYQESLSLDTLSEIIPCNSQYLCRFFKEISGMTPIRYLITYRIDQASTALEQTSKPISEIALDCGFENISYFIRKFKEIKGCTPKEYRKIKTSSHNI